MVFSFLNWNFLRLWHPESRYYPTNHQLSKATSSTKIKLHQYFFLASKHVLLRLIFVSTSKSGSNHKFLLVLSKKFIHDDDDYDDMKQTSLHHFYRTRKEIRKILFLLPTFYVQFLRMEKTSSMSRHMSRKKWLKLRMRNVIYILS